MKKLYEYACHDCKVTWEREYAFGKCANKTKCPECRKLCEQNWRGRSAPAVHFKGAGWTQTTGYNRSGGSDEVNQKLQDKCKERMDTGWQHYSKYTPSEGYIKEVGARRLNEEEVKQGLNASKKLSTEIYNKAGQDPSKKIKPQ